MDAKLLFSKKMLQYTLQFVDQHISKLYRKARLFWALIRITEKGVGFKGGSLHDGFGGFDGFGGSGKHLAQVALLFLVLQNTAQ